MQLDLNEEETAALVRELPELTFNDRYPLSPRIRLLNEILEKLKPRPARAAAASPPPKIY